MLLKAKDYIANHHVADIALLCIATLLATRGWFNLEIPQGHDTVGDMLLGQAALQTVSLHNPFSGWSGDWFLGYPLFYVHPPLVGYLIWALSYPFGWILGTKLIYLTFYVLSGIFAYLYVFELTRNRPASFAAGLAYVFLPYHVLEVGFEGHHGAFGLPYMLTPLILLFLERLVRAPGLKYVLISGILLALLTLTYPQVFPLLIGPFLALYVLLRIWWERKRGMKYLREIALCSIVAFLLPLLVTAFWWLPLIYEVRYSDAASFPLDAAREYSTTFLQAITLRPPFCCAPTSVYGASGSAPVEILRMLPFVLVVLGIILNRRNRYVWLFLALALIAVLLAMGPDSPIKLFNVAHRYVPFFSGLRTPWRFLLFGSLAYAVLIGFCVKGMSDWLGRLRFKKLTGPVVSTIVLVLTGLIVAGNTWQETRTAFSTFTLTNDQRNALAWLKAQDDGDYRITDLPLQTWVYNADGRWIINPLSWTYLHGKDNVYGGIPAAATVFAGDVFEYLNHHVEVNQADISEWLNVFNVRYIVIDKTNPLSTQLNLRDHLDLAWSNGTIDIYENHDVKPRIFCVSATEQRDIPIWTADTINVFLANGCEYIVVSLDDQYSRSSNLTLKATFQVTNDEAEWPKLGIDVGYRSFNKDDSIRLVFYSEKAMPNLYLTLDALESDGSRYGIDLKRTSNIKAGWNEVEFPLSLLLLKHPAGGNDQIDPDQIETIYFGFGLKNGAAGTDEFSLYFDSLSVVSIRTNTDIKYERTGPGSYRVQFDAESPCRLVLSESYYPNWVAHVDGTTIPSEITYECLNGFDLEPGQHDDITLRFVTSPLRVAGVILSSISILLLTLLIVIIVVVKIISSKPPGSLPPN